MKTIETNFVPLYKIETLGPQIPKSEYNAIYELFNSVEKNPKDFYWEYNQGRIRIKDNSIVYLYAIGLGLKTLYPSIGDLENLKRLDLENNQIQEIPEEIGKLNNLKLLYLRNNPLSQKAKGFLEELNKEKHIKVFY